MKEKMEKTICFRAVLEVIGKPKEHVEAALKGYLEKLKQDTQYKVVLDELAEIKKQDNEELWAIFAEVEIWTERLENISHFCFNYMPSLIEILEPAHLTIKDAELSEFLNDLQAKLHQVDMVAKQVKLENDILKKNMAGLVKNYLTILLGKKALTALQLSTLTGINQDTLEDYLDILIDEGKVDLDGDAYSLKAKEVQA